MKKSQIKKTTSYILLISLVVASSIVAAPLIMAQNIPALPALGASDSEMPQLPKFPTDGAKAELPKLPEFVAPNLATNATEEEKKKSEQIISNNAESVSQVNSANIIPEIDLPETETALDNKLNTLAPLANSGTKPAVNTISAPANFDAPEFRPATIGNEQPAANQMVEIPTLPQQSAEVPVLPTVKVLNSEPSNSVENNISNTAQPIANTTVIEPEVKLTNTQPTQVEVSKKDELKSVLDNVFGEKKEEPKKLEEDSTKEIAAEPITDEKIISAEEVQALEAGSYETDAFDNSSTTKSKVKKTELKPIDFKSKTYTETQLGNQLIQETMRGNRENATALINSGVSVNSTNESQQTPLMGAAFSGNSEMFDFLISNGALINAKDKNGNTALHVATSRGNDKMVQKIISSGADLDSRNNAGDSPLLIAISNNKINIVQRLLARGANVNTNNNEGLTPLHLAANFGNSDLVKILLSKGADKNAVTQKGIKPYDIAVTRNPNIAALLATTNAQQKSDYATQLSMFPTQYVDEQANKQSAQEPESTQEQNDWWGDKYVLKNKNSQPASNSAASDVKKKYTTEEFIEKQKSTNKIVSEAQQEEQLRIPANQPVIDMAVVSKINQTQQQSIQPQSEELTIQEQSPQLASVPAPKSMYYSAPNKVSEPTISQNIQPIAEVTNTKTSAAFAPSTPVQGLTKTTYETGRQYYQVAPNVSAIPANNIELQIPVRNNYSPKLEDRSQAKISAEEKPSIIQTQNSVPMSMRLSGLVKQPANYSPAIIEPKFAKNIEVVSAPVNQVEEESKLEPLVQETPTQPQNIAVPAPKIEVLSTPAQKVEVLAPTMPVSPPASIANLAPKTAQVPTELKPASTTLNYNSNNISNAPTPNLNKVDYVGFYNNSQQKIVSPLNPSAGNSASKNTPAASAALAKNYSNLSAEEKAKWDIRMNQWKEGKKSGSISQQMLEKQERILRVIYADKFEAESRK